MQQYFIKENGKIGECIPLNDEILHHIKHVLRKEDDYVFRIVDAKGEVYLAKLAGDSAFIMEELDSDSELDVDVTIVLSLIKNEKFDYCLQKLTELGVKRILPYEAKRSVVKIKDPEHKLERYRKIVQEASEQSKRNVVPVIPEIINVKKLGDYLGDFNYVAYEKENSTHIDYAGLKGNVTILIGPEGGFEKEEIEAFEGIGFLPVSLGKRILRAETAALYCMANIAGAHER